MVDQRQAFHTQAGTQAKEFDAGLRAYMLKVYNYMASGVLLTGMIALMASESPTIMSALFNVVPYGNGFALAGYTGLGWIVAISPLAFILVLSFGVNKMSSSTLQMVFWAFAAVMGLSISSLLIRYTGESVARTFFITAAAFAGLSLYGYTTKRSLSGLRTFLVMGVIGLLIAMVVNMFMQSTMMQFIISAGGVLIFSALTAYDTQKIKEAYYHVSHNTELAGKAAIMGAVTLYLDFVNLFMFLLHFLGNRE